ncbi:MAG: ATP-binding protein [Nitrobacter sp.]
MTTPLAGSDSGAFGFNLAKYFVGIAAVIITASMVVLAYSMSEKIKNSMMRSAAAEGSLLIEAFLSENVQDLASSNSLSPTSTQKLDKLLDGRLRGRVKVIKIWLRDGTRVYANPQLPLDEKLPSRNIDSAFEGLASAYFGELDDPENQFERSLNTPLIEIYMPLRKTNTSEIIAVGEIYNDATRFVADLDSVRLASFGITSAVAAPMMFLLFLLIKRSRAAIRRHQNSLDHKIVEAQALAAQNDQFRREADEARLEAMHSNEFLLGQIGQDLHDGPVQLLSILALKLSELVDENSALKIAEKPAVAASLRDLTSGVLTDLRDISTGLVLPELDGLELEEVLLFAAHQHEQMTGTKVLCRIDQLPGQLPLALKVCLFRIVQEGLNNSFRHAAGHGQCITASANTDRIALVVSDSGSKGQSSKPSNRVGLGIPGLRRRVEAFRGVFEFSSHASKGTHIRVTLPVSSDVR